MFICHCGSNIAGVVDVAEVARELKRRHPEVAVYDHEHCCSDDGLRRIREAIEREGAARLIIGCCTPTLHGELFKRAAEEAGLNRGFVEIVNLREQCSWVHSHDPARATVKAADLLSMAVAAAPMAREAKVAKVPVERAVLVIGGGVAGVTAALALADMGVKVYLVEREGFLGGHMAKWDKVFPTLDCSICVLGPQLARAYGHPLITVYTLSEVVEVRGAPGSYTVKVLRRARYVDERLCTGCNKCLEVCPVEAPNEYDYGIGVRKAIVKPSPEAVPPAPYIDASRCIGCMSCLGVCEPKAINFNDKDEYVEVKVGAIIVATGFKPFDPRGLDEYLYGRCPNVVTGPEYERMLNSSGPTRGRIVRISDGREPRRVAFIQCVGSRSDRLGRPYCSRVCCMNAIKQAIQTKLAIPGADVAIFYTDIRASGKACEEAYRRAMEMGVRFIRARVGQLRATRGGGVKVFYEDTLSSTMAEEEFDLVVLSVGMEPPQGVRELARLLGLQLGDYDFLAEYHLKLNPADTFSKGVFVAGACTGPKDITESVMQAGLAAARAAELIGRGEVEVEVYAPTIDPERCRRCLACVNACPFGALRAEGGRVVVDEYACRGCGACLVAFMCQWCGYAAADNAGTSKIQYPTNVRIIRVPCSVRVSPAHVLEAFSLGADGVLIVGCHEQDCHYRVGRSKANERVEALRRLLSELGVDPRRLRIEGASATEGRRLAELIRGFVEEVASLGPIGSEVAVGVK
ncbi:disulfide reductase [Candidatus Geothermarchaeota archaeon ex4572_27]|nr:MAG: disulfide reductase [Candidatus Geothermarchaeota archaeon ex4572_27]